MRKLFLKKLPFAHSKLQLGIPRYVIIAITLQEQIRYFSTHANKLFMNWLKSVHKFQNNKKMRNNGLFPLKLHTWVVSQLLRSFLFDRMQNKRVHLPHHSNYGTCLTLFSVFCWWSSCYNTFFESCYAHVILQQMWWIISSVWH